MAMSGGGMDVAYMGIGLYGLHNQLSKKGFIKKWMTAIERVSQKKPTIGGSGTAGRRDINSSGDDVDEFESLCSSL